MPTRLGIPKRDKPRPEPNGDTRASDRSRDEACDGLARREGEAQDRDAGGELGSQRAERASERRCGCISP